VVILNIIAGTTLSLKNSAESVTDSNNCSESEDGAGNLHFYNISDKYCYNTTADGGGLTKQHIAGQYDLPLNSLFSTGGVAFLVLMAGLLITIVIIALKGMRK
jgi:hypothetical protein